MQEALVLETQASVALLSVLGIVTSIHFLASILQVEMLAWLRY